MKDLAFLTSPDMSKAKVITTSEIISEYADVEHHSVTRLIRKFEHDLEEFGVIGFEIHKPLKGSTGGRPTKIYQLNRNQAMLLITWLDNTETVRAFKLALVKRFDEMEKELQARKIGRISEKAVKRSLNEAIDHWENAPKFPYPTMNKLLIKLATGSSINDVKARDTSQEIMLNLLTSTEQQAYLELEQVAIGLIMANLEYKFIKEMLEKITNARA
ncbi:Rha family transcriptional regulator [Lactococcus sp. DD01]|uniref:Rha family transcriptional regulator n=1 Tax=Lactococcus sp. DD01 TaxID=1776443 RepID=UPI0007765F8C|nr:Rha family transcriptional regulator [Lactococcus sp. DD01]KXT62339.1 prophage ps3 protein 13 [Lactococcus sp. DD01]